jgi:hypothetical protein
MSPALSTIHIGLPPQIIASRKVEDRQLSSKFSFGFLSNLAEHSLFQIQQLIELMSLERK